MASRMVKIPAAPENAVQQIDVTVSISIGVASAPAHADSWDALFLAADNALCRSKELGRNRIEMSK